MRYLPSGPLALLWLGLFLSACTPDRQPKGNPSAPGVLVSQIRLHELREVDKIVGRTLAVNQVSLRARVEGYLQEVPFREGADVKKGDLLFVIDPSIYEARVKAAEGLVAEAKAALHRAGRDLARYRELAKKGHASKQKLDEAEANRLEAEARLKSAEAGLAQARVNLEHTHITAPIDGRMGGIQVSVGNLVGPQTGELARLVELDPIYARFNVSERDYLDFMERVEKDPAGLPKIAVRLLLPNDKTYDQVGRIDFVDNRVNPRTGTILLRARFANPDKRLLPGINVTVVLQGEKTHKLLLVPQAALLEDQAGRYVLVVDRDRKIARRGVKLGGIYGAYRVVKEGLEPGEAVVVEGMQKVRPGLQVTTKPWEAPPVTQPGGGD